LVKEEDWSWVEEDWAREWGLGWIMTAGARGWDGL